MSQSSPEDRAPHFSRLFFSWVFPLLARGRKKPLTVDELLPLRERENPELLVEKFDREYERNRGSSRPLLKTVWALEKRNLQLSVLISMVHLAALIVNPLILRELIRFLQGRTDYSVPYGYLLASALILMSVCGGLSVHHMFHRILTTMIRVRIPLVTTIYRKAMALSQESRLSAPSGQIINLMGTDAQKFVNAINMTFSLWLHPLQLLFSLIALFWILGPAASAGVLVLLGTLLLSVVLARRQIKIRSEMMELSDQRVSLMNEILLSIRMIKFFAWEKSFEQFVQKIRSRELGFLARLLKFEAFETFVFLSTPVMVAFATFSTIALSGRTFDVADVFSALTFFTLLRHAMGMLPDVVTTTIEANVSLKRIEEFMLLSELRTAPPIQTSGPGSIELAGAAWNWKSGVPALADIDLVARAPRLICVVGEVGSGKSALLQGILGEIPLQTGSMRVEGKVAYVSQLAWTQNDTIKNNILFGESYDAEKYSHVLDICGLKTDLAQLPNGDETEIGERGINLSGGQKQRISMARAVYADAQIYLLDDPLSALDVKVGAHVFDRAIRTHLSQTLRILVTHRLEYVDEADEVLVVANGRIVERGSAAQLRVQQGAFSSVWRAHLLGLGHTDENAEAHSVVGLPVRGENELPEEDEDWAGKVERRAAGQLVVVEERFSGIVSRKVYALYLALIGPGLMAGVLGLLFFAKEFFNISSDSWLAWWSTATDFDTLRFAYGFALLGMGTCLVIYSRSLILSLRGLVAGRELHNRLLRSVLRAPMTFFEETPTGRILNRFSRDMEAVDLTIPRTLQDFLSTAFTIVATTTVIGIVKPIALIGIVPIACLYVLVQKYFRPSSREGQRLDSITRSPIFAQFSESLVGAPVIRAFQALPRMEHALLRSLETNSRTFYTLVSVNRWLGVRVELLGALIVGSASLAAVYTVESSHIGFSSMAVTYSLAVTSALYWAIRSFTQLESNMTSVERIAYYSELASERWEGEPAPANWPTRGEITFEALSLRYRPELPPAVDNLTARILGGEKVGVVGRTGSGKSSLMLGLYRLLEHSGGRVLIDGVDIGKLSLHDLRSALAIIPQDPVLFRGSIRRNLDPFDMHDDKELYWALEKAHIVDLIGTMPGGLQAEVSEGGANLSVGQRQLLCLARALLQRNKILLLDEPTASIDVATDALVQRTIREAFKDCTVLTIAHRLNTVLDSDRIMLLDQGRLVAFDVPDRVLSTGEIQIDELKTTEYPT